MNANPQLDAQLENALVLRFGLHCGLNADWAVTAFHVGPAGSVANVTDGAAYLIEDEENGRWDLVTHHGTTPDEEAVRWHATFSRETLLRWLTEFSDDMPCDHGDLLTLFANAGPFALPVPAR